MWESFDRGARDAVMPFVNRRNFEMDRSLERSETVEDRDLREKVDRARIEAIADRTQVERERQDAIKTHQQDLWRREDEEFESKREGWNSVFDLNQNTLDKSQSHALKLKEKFESELDKNALRAAKASLSPEQAKKMAELREKWDDPDFKNRMATLAAAHSGFDPSNPDPDTLFREASIDKEKYQGAYNAYYATLSAEREGNQAKLHDANAWPENLVFAERNVAVQKQALAGLYRQAGQLDSRFISGRPMLDVVRSMPTLDEQAAVEKVARDEAAPIMGLGPEGSGSGFDFGGEMGKGVQPVDPALLEEAAAAAPEAPAEAPGHWPSPLRDSVESVLGVSPKDWLSQVGADIKTSAKGLAALPSALWSGDPKARDAVIAAQELYRPLNTSGFQNWQRQNPHWAPGSMWEGWNRNESGAGPLPDIELSGRGATGSWIQKKLSEMVAPRGSEAPRRPRGSRGTTGSWGGSARPATPPGSTGSW